MNLQWRFLVIVSLWGLVSNPTLKAAASTEFDLTVVQVEHRRSERLSEPVNKVAASSSAECDNLTCDMNKGLLCSGPGHGECVCGKCSCKPKYTGPACQCPKDEASCMTPGSNSICSGHGKCECGQCVCNVDGNRIYTGRYCEKCPTCPSRCGEYKDCVLCEVHKRGVLYNPDTDSCGDCALSPVVEEGMIEANYSSQMEHLCRYYDDEDCLYTYVFSYNENQQPVIRAQKELQCPKASTVVEAHRNISIVGDQFMLDGQPLHIVSGCLHYFRLPALYWRDRLRKLKAAGLNSVATYVEWSYHEPEERQYLFEGDRDIVQYIQTAAEEGLHVVLRVGPYICAERDMGGLPYWLLSKYPNIKLRTTDNNYQQEAKIWIDKLFSQISPLLYGNGGPIILVQVENEYGSYGSDMAYKVQVRDMLHEHVTDKALLFTTDGAPPSFFRAGAVPNTLTTIDFNAGANVRSLFNELRKYMPHGPLMNSEFYTGWLTHWGEHFATANADTVVRTLGDMLDYGAHVNFYMFFGGSNFEYTAGANYDGTYKPDITSYDYDSPLTEAGDPTPKYFMIRDKLKTYNLVNESIEPPIPSEKGNYGTVSVSFKVSLLSAEGRASLSKQYGHVTGSSLPTFEQLRQRGGLMLYETTLPEGDGLLGVRKPRDLVLVFVDGVYQGRISRMRKIYSLPISAKSGSVLSLLVENQGRINYGHKLHDFKGILSAVKHNNKELDGNWTVSGYPLQVFNLSQVEQSGAPSGPSFYEGQFILPANQYPLDTFLDTTGWGKGFVWINGYNLGRYWPNVGPQVTLYVPGIWLKAAPEENHLQILELNKPASALSMKFINHPILNATGNINLA